MQRADKKQSRKPPTLEIEDKNHRSQMAFIEGYFKANVDIYGYL